MTAPVGKPAPEFETKAYSQGESSGRSRLDYIGKWVTRSGPRTWPFEGTPIKLRQLAKSVAERTG